MAAARRRCSNSLGRRSRLGAEPDRRRRAGAAARRGSIGRLLRGARRRPAALGRVFTTDDDQPGGPPLVIIADALWGRLFNREPVARRTDDPPRRPGDDGHRRHAARRSSRRSWTPTSGVRSGSIRRGRRAASSFCASSAKLKPGITVAQAQAGMSAVAAQLAAEDPEWERARVALVPLQDDHRRQRPSDADRPRARGRPRALYRVRERHESAAGARGGPRRVRSRSAPRSARAAVRSCGSC